MKNEYGLAVALNTKYLKILRWLVFHLQDTVSVHRPDFYAKRFMNFMSTKIFKKIPSCKQILYSSNHIKTPLM